ncbi:elongation factor P [Candidatus Peregrinibacteria bacterium]|nr:elongation factor P [Candidatus Peregrinibacteria bacterium]
MQTSDFKKGLAIKHNGETFIITQYQFVNPGKGAAFTRVKLKNAKTGKVVEQTFRSGEQIEEANMEYKKCQYMYSDGSDFHFMDNATYEQFAIPADIVAELADYMMDGMDVTVVFVDNAPVTLQLPTKMAFKVVSCPPGEKGDTATGGTKPAEIETGAKVAVPLFIKEGDKIRVNTDTGEYVERANE